MQSTTPQQLSPLQQSQLSQILTTKIKSVCNDIKYQVFESTIGYLSLNLEKVVYPVVTLIDFDLATGVGGYSASLQEHAKKLNSLVPVTERCLQFVKKWIPKARVVYRFFRYLEKIIDPLPDFQKGDAAHILTYCFVFLTVIRRSHAIPEIDALGLSSKKLLAHFKTLSHRKQAAADVSPLSLMFDAISPMNFSQPTLKSLMPSASTLTTFGLGWNGASSMMATLGLNGNEISMIQELRERGMKLFKRGTYAYVIDTILRSIFNPVAENNYNRKLWGCYKSRGADSCPPRGAWNQDNTGLVLSLGSYFRRAIKVQIPPQGIMKHLSSPFDEFQQIFNGFEKYTHGTFQLLLRPSAIKVGVPKGSPSITVQNVDATEPFFTLYVGLDEDEAHSPREESRVKKCDANGLSERSRYVCPMYPTAEAYVEAMKTNECTDEENTKRWSNACAEYHTAAAIKQRIELMQLKEQKKHLERTYITEEKIEHQTNVMERETEILRAKSSAATEGSSGSVDEILEHMTTNAWKGAMRALKERLLLFVKHEKKEDSSWAEFALEKLSDFATAIIGTVMTACENQQVANTFILLVKEWREQVCVDISIKMGLEKKVSVLSREGVQKMQEDTMVTVNKGYEMMHAMTGPGLADSLQSGISLLLDATGASLTVTGPMGIAGATVLTSAGKFAMRCCHQRLKISLIKRMYTQGLANAMEIFTAPCIKEQKTWVL